MRNSLVFILLLSLVFAVGCDERDNNNDNNINNINNVNNGNDDTIQMVQNSSNPNFIANEDEVRLENVVVTAIDRYGTRTGSVYISEPDGGSYSGVIVYNYDTAAQWFVDLQVGDLVTVTGRKSEYCYEDPGTGECQFDDPLTEIVEPIVTILGSGTPVTPTVIQGSDLNSVATGEQWEGVLVTLQNVRVLDVSTGERDEAFLYQSTKAQNDLVDISTITQGVCLASLTGVVTYFFDYYILPRTAADIVVSADDNACPQVADEICDNGEDDDGNGFVDCEDFACIGDPACPAKVENDDTLCADGNDNDEDGLTDCADPSCYGHPNVTVCTETNCSDTVDNDGDGYADCADFDCKDEVACEGNFETNCSDGNDDDEDGYIDCEDFDCAEDASCIETNCTDTTDNDGDGFTDCDDFDCLYSEPTCQTGQEVTDAACSDGIDNDDNGFTDCDDFSCSRSPVVTICEGNAITCADGTDNNDDGFVDCGDFACRYCSTTDPTKNRVVSTCLPCE